MCGYVVNRVLNRLSRRYAPRQTGGHICLRPPGWGRDTVIKQLYMLELMRLLDYQRLKNMAALVVAVAYFAAA